jgi:cephalosporin-C deacetylase
MALFDLPLEELRVYRPEREEPADFDGFWSSTLEEARARRSANEFVPAHSELRTVEVFDVTFSGYGGHPIKGWLILPRHRSEPLPAIVEYVGYGGGRALPYEWLVWASAGFAHLVMDTRGQGSAWSSGDTGDPEPEGSSPQHPGFLTRGVFDPRTYYYRRLITDAVLAIDCVRDHPAVDPDRVLVAGDSQGGGLALAAAGLGEELAAAVIDVPFLCHFRRAVDLAERQPYLELRSFLAVHRNRVEDVFRTLSYVDGMNFAVRATAPALVSVGLMDDVCPPSTVFAAFNHYAGPKELRVWPYNGHEAGSGHHLQEKLRFLAERGLQPGLGP